MISTFKIGLGNLKGRNLGVVKRLISKWILGENYVKLRIGFIWLRDGDLRRALVNTVMNLRVQKRRCISLLAERSISLSRRTAPWSWYYCRSERPAPLLSLWCAFTVPWPDGQPDQQFIPCTFLFFLLHLIFWGPLLPTSCLPVAHVRSRTAPVMLVIWQLPRW
jgi:hypothetical protein